MNWIGWTVLIVLLSMLLYLLIIPFVVVGVGWGIFVIVISYFYMNALFWIVCRGELPYWYIIKTPYVDLWDWIKSKI